MKYIAYGSNLNLKQMAKRCPTARVVGTALLKDWKLTFRNVATIEPCVNSITPVGIWEIDKESERALDIYEGFPHLYRKEYLDVVVNGKSEKCLVYIMNGGNPRLPHISYFNCILDGYRDCGLDECLLMQALEDTEQRNK